jgi:uncharacterized membrane protein YvbJ
LITCQACGTENPSGSTFCKKCANRLDAQTQESIVQRRAEHTATGIRWSAVLIAIILMLIVIAVLAVLTTHLL